nr:site-specific integrase [Cupriavidus sp. LEh25]
MAADGSTVEPVWERYPLIASNCCARRWIQSCVMLGLAKNTIAAYMYAIEGFLRFALSHSVDLRSVSHETIAQYVGELRTQPRRANANVVRIDSGGFLSNATLQQRITAVRLLFEFLVDEGLVRTNPVSRGRRPGQALRRRDHPGPQISPPRQGQGRAVGIAGPTLDPGQAAQPPAVQP